MTRLHLLCRTRPGLNALKNISGVYNHDVMTSAEEDFQSWYRLSSVITAQLGSVTIPKKYKILEGSRAVTDVSRDFLSTASLLLSEKARSRGAMMR